MAINFLPALPWDYVRVRIRLLTPLLGTVPKNRAVFAGFQQDKAKKGAEEQRKLAAKADLPPAATLMPSGDEEATDEVAEARGREELAMVTDESERGWTGFLEKNGKIYLSTHMWRGFLSAQAQTVKEATLKEMGFGHIKQLKNKIKVGVFVVERLVELPRPDPTVDYANDDRGHPLLVDAGGGKPVCERSLRASTPQGDRTAVVRSDVVLGGAEIEFTLKVLRKVAPPLRLIGALLQMGEGGQGIGQWRSSGVFGQFELIKFCLLKDGKEVPLDASAADEDAAEEAAAAAPKPPKRAPAKPKAAKNGKAKVPVGGDDDEEGEDGDEE